jgi:AcrR family transcriptional regulator
MAQGPLTTERAVERRRQLLTAAQELFADRDYDDVSMDEIAEAAGVSHGLLFQYFGSKKGLYIAGIDNLLEEFRRRTEPDPSVPPPEQLRAGLRAYVDWVAEHPQGFRSLMGQGAAFAEVRETLERQRWWGIENRLSAGLGVDPSRPAVRVGLRAWQGYVQDATLAWLDNRDLSRDQLVELLAAAFVGIVQAIASVDPRRCRTRARGERPARRPGTPSAGSTYVVTTEAGQVVAPDVPVLARS